MFAVVAIGVFAAACKAWHAPRVCTLVLMHGLWPEAPLVLAANRDEQLDRPAEPPRLRTLAGVRVFAPLDRRAGGTWLGLNGTGMLVAVTNRFGDGHGGSDPRSRGALVTDALATDSPARALERVLGHAFGVHRPFNLVIADRTEAHLVWQDGEAVHHRPLTSGVHVITERSVGRPPPPRERFVHERLDLLDLSQPPSDRELAALLATHHDDLARTICMHVPERNYGTRSATLVRMGTAHDDVRLLHADRPPCESPWTDLSIELAALWGEPAARSRQ